MELSVPKIKAYKLGHKSMFSMFEPVSTLLKKEEHVPYSAHLSLRLNFRRPRRFLRRARVGSAPHARKWAKPNKTQNPRLPRPCLNSENP
jgi:hypothetical protein